MINKIYKQTNKYTPEPSKCYGLQKNFQIKKSLTLKSELLNWILATVRS